MRKILLATCAFPMVAQAADVGTFHARNIQALTTLTLPDLSTIIGTCTTIVSVNCVPALGVTQNSAREAVAALAAESAAQATANAALPKAGGTMIGALMHLYDVWSGTYNFSGAMSSGSIPAYAAITVTGTPTNVPAFGFLSPLAFLVTNNSTASSMNGLGIKAVSAAGASGTLQGALLEAFQNGTPASGSYDNGYVGAQLAATLNFNNGGSVAVGGNTLTQNYLLTHGGGFGGNLQAICGSGATYLRLCNGNETDISVAATGAAAPAQKYGTTIIQTAADASRGLYDDAGLAFGAQTGSSAPWKTIFQAGTITAQFPMTTDSWVFRFQPQSVNCPGGVCSTPTVGGGMDFTGVNYSAGSGPLKFPGGSIDGSGNITGASLTATGLVSQPYVGTNAQGQLVAASSPGSGVSSFNTRTGAVTLTSGDVTTALSYTPYNGSTNPNSYVTATTAPVTSVNTLVGGVVTKHCDTFTSGGTWVKLSWAQQVVSEITGAGGGGGKGGSSAGAVIESAGGAGGAGNHIKISGPASAFANSAAIVVGSGGAGSTGGNAAAGTQSCFAGHCAWGGGAGADGAQAVAAAGGGGAGVGGSGGNATGATPAASVSGGQAALAGAVAPLLVPGQGTAGAPGLATGTAGAGSGMANDAPTGGGSGAGLTAANATAAGGNGTGPNSVVGAAGGAACAAGGAGVSVTGLYGTGGAGGGSCATAAGGAGGAGSLGGGGGSGGAGLTANGGGGAGGNGGAGIVQVCQTSTN